MATESMGLAFVTLSILIFLTCLILHSSRHFNFQCCIRSKNFMNNPHRNGLTKRNSLRVRSSNIMRHIRRNESICRCCIVGIEDNFDFFPISFLFYNIFIITLCLIIISKYTLFKVEDNIQYNINSHNYTHTIDWIIVYSLIFLSIWESFFNFHRFYTTYFASKKMLILNSKQIMFKFSLFCIPFLCIFILQIHFYYYLYPVVISFYLIFNVINIWLFGHILIVQYRFVMGIEKYLTNIHDDMLESVYLMRRISLISCIASSIHISFFTFVYNINIILFLPILWSISCTCLTLNFARNRQYIHAKYLSLQLWAYNYNYHCGNICKRASTSNAPLSPLNNSNNKTQKHIMQSPRSAITLQQTQNATDKNRSQTVQSQKEQQKQPVDWKESDENKDEILITNGESIPVNLHSEECPLSPINIRKVTDSKSVPDTRKNISKSKAMKLLGIATPQSTKSVSNVSNTTIYVPPTTPMPALFSHLWEKHAAFPSHIPPGPHTLYEEQDTDMAGIEIVTENDKKTKNDIIEERDEFNEAEMLEIKNKFVKKSQLIRVSAKQPQLMMQKISTNIDTPSGIKLNNFISPSSKSGSKSPFSKKKSDKHVSLLTDGMITPIKDDHAVTDQRISDLRVSLTNTDTNLEVIIIDTSESEEEPQVMNLPKYFSHQTVDVNEHNVHGEDLQEHDAKKASPTKASKFGNFVKKITTPRSREKMEKFKKMISFSPKTVPQTKIGNRVRSQSDGKEMDLARNSLHLKATKSMTNVDGILELDAVIDVNPDVVSMFDILAKHGFYSQQNVASAQQLKNYNMQL